jgi:hypothetical protein
MRVWVKLWVGVLKPIPSNLLKRMAGTTGLEPAASAVTGQRSNQLNYVPTPEISHIAESCSGCGFAGFAYSAAFALLAPDSGNSGMNRPQTAYKNRCAVACHENHLITGFAAGAAGIFSDRHALNRGHMICGTPARSGAVICGVVRL